MRFTYLSLLAASVASIVSAAPVQPEGVVSLAGAPKHVVDDVVLRQTDGDWSPDDSGRAVADWSPNNIGERASNPVADWSGNDGPGNKRRDWWTTVRFASPEASATADWTTVAADWTTVV